MVCCFYWSNKGSLEALALTLRGRVELARALNSTACWRLANLQPRTEGVLHEDPTRVLVCVATSWAHRAETSLCELACSRLCSLSKVVR